MERSAEKIQKLVSRGERFTYENFATKGHYGYPDAFTPEYVAWRIRVKSAIFSLFGEDSATMDMLKSGFEVPIIGFDRNKFQLAQSYFLGALKAAKDVLEEDTFGELRDADARAPGAFSNEVFIVHGHDDQSKTELEILLKEMGLEPVVLHRQADQGMTIIEKFEKHSNVGYAFIILTPDEVAYLANQKDKPDDERTKEWRARPNVIFEFGYFVGKLGRPRVCCLYKGDVTLPSDIEGLLYKKFKRSVEEVAYSITKELKACGYRLK